MRLVDIVITNIDSDVHLENASEDRDLLSGSALLIQVQSGRVRGGIGSRHYMHELQRAGAQASRKDGDLLELFHQVAADNDLDRERQLRHVTARKSAHDALERSVTTPAIVIFARHAVETKSHVRQRRTVFLKRRPDAIEVPPVGDEADCQTRIADGAERFDEMWMQCRF